MSPRLDFFFLARLSVLLLPIRLLLLAEPDWLTFRFLPRLKPGRGKTFDRAELIFQHPPLLSTQLSHSLASLADYAGILFGIILGFRQKNYAPA